MGANNCKPETETESIRLVTLKAQHRNELDALEKELQQELRDFQHCVHSVNKAARRGQQRALCPPLKDDQVGKLRSRFDNQVQVGPIETIGRYDSYAASIVTRLGRIVHWERGDYTDRPELTLNSPNTLESVGLDQ